MDALELKPAVEKLHEGECPKCFNKLSYMSNNICIGELEKNGMAAICNTLRERYIVWCPVCGYHSPATQIGLKIIPTDRIIEFDSNWDVPYLEENTLVYGEEGKNPFNKD